MARARPGPLMSHPLTLFPNPGPSLFPKFAFDPYYLLPPGPASWFPIYRFVSSRVDFPGRVSFHFLRSKPHHMSKIPFIPLPFYKSYFRESTFKARHSHISSEDIARVSLGKENWVGSTSVIQVVYIHDRRRLLLLNICLRGMVLPRCTRYKTPLP